MPRDNSATAVAACTPVCRIVAGCAASALPAVSCDLRRRGVIRRPSAQREVRVCRPPGSGRRGPGVVPAADRSAARSGVPGPRPTKATSPASSPQSKPPGSTVRSFSLGTTTNSGTAAWACTPPPTFTTAPPPKSASNAASCSPPPTTPTPNASSANRPNHPPCRPAHGSTHPTRKRPPLSKYRSTVPHSG